MTEDGEMEADESPMRYGHPRFYELLEEEGALHSRKAHDYAGEANPLSNFMNVAAVTGLQPWQVGYMFIATKFFRLVNLITSGEDPLNEPIEDTLTDLSVYAKLTRIMLEEQKAAVLAFQQMQEQMAAQAEAEEKERVIPPDPTNPLD